MNAIFHITYLQKNMERFNISMNSSSAICITTAFDVQIVHPLPTAK